LLIIDLLNSQAMIDFHNSVALNRVEYFCLVLWIYF